MRRRGTILRVAMVQESSSYCIVRSLAVQAVTNWRYTSLQGEQYPCKDEVFRMTYEPVVEP